MVGKLMFEIRGLCSGIVKMSTSRQCGGSNPEHNGVNSMGKNFNHTTLILGPGVVIITD